MCQTQREQWPWRQCCGLPPVSLVLAAAAAAWALTTPCLASHPHRHHHQLQQRYLQEADGAKAHLSAWKAAWPVKREAVVEGELVLGGLMMVHERSDTVTCGPVMPQGGVQALETMLYTLDRINAPPSLLPNVTIGAHILDDCDMDTYGLEMAVDFIKGTGNVNYFLYLRIQTTVDVLSVQM
ncbi:metabotropic glutamate receptor 2-like [Schistocerca serialis cubense]|uniref:metabotropic glutamate receptor 2-like n=1 Tax=Schistocerca serialis cubense TaxID=2023355 RepID=UPI00214E803A|nr:metabotropic glutamate receptor 2-like [Schistocerca serialis cubense]